MKLADRIKEIAAMEHVYKVLDTVDQSNVDDKEKYGISVKHVYVMDYNGDCMEKTKIPLYVIDEGFETEECFYQGTQYPGSRIQANRVISEVEEASDGSISEVKRLVTSTGEKKEVTATVIKEAVQIVEKPVAEEPVAVTKG